MTKKTPELIRAIFKLYDEMGYSTDELLISSIISDFENDYLTVNTTRDGREVLWYIDSTHEACVVIETGEVLTPEEVEDQLC